MKNITLELHSILSGKIDPVFVSPIELDIKNRLWWKICVSIDQEINMSLAITLIGTI